VAALLSEEPAREVAVNALIGAGTPVEAAEQARACVRAGFRTLKVKVGDEDGLERVAAVRRAVGWDVAVRVDANGAWSVSEAVDRLADLAEFGIELCEEPVHGVEELRAVRRALDGRVAIAMDETAGQAGAVSSGAADAVCLKIARGGGISGALEAARAARAAEADVYLASTLDGPTGIAAALHVAAALGVRRACGLATLGLFADGEDPFPVRDGAIAVPTGPGLGLE
jgi:L-alanine-DL-glutamate epimerase-like enolase superfamily enzyme